MQAPVPSGSGFACPSLLRRGVVVCFPKTRPGSMRFSGLAAQCSVSVVFAAQGCCWLSEAAPGVDVAMKMTT